MLVLSSLSKGLAGGDEEWRLLQAEGMDGGAWWVPELWGQMNLDSVPGSARSVGLWASDSEHGQPHFLPLSKEVPTLCNRCED